MEIKGLVAIWGVSLLADLLSSFILRNEIAILLPAIYMGLSFFIFNKQLIGYRIFHHICITPLVIYYLVGLVFQAKDVYFGSSLEAMLAYIWFENLSISYTLFLAMYSISYLPYMIYMIYMIYKKVKNA